jgi:hypothetical protein
MASLINFYEKIKDTPKTWNPNYKLHKLKIPFRMIIIGGSGSGKTNFVMNLIKITSGTFENITLCTKNADEVLYNHLKKQLKDDLTIFEDGVIPDIKEFNDKRQRLIIFDDLCLQKDQKRIQEYWVRGRKLGLSMVYISQSFYRIPKTIRINSNYVVFRRLSSKKDLESILKDFTLNISLQELQKIYDYATKTPMNVLLIDVDAPDELKYRLNFEPIEY